MAYHVVSPSAVFKDERGSQHIRYADDVLPENVDEGSLKHLLDLGFVEDDSKASSKKSSAK